MGYTWEQALGAVFISGVIFLILTISGIRVHRAVPCHYRAIERRHRRRPSGHQGLFGQPDDARPAVRDPGLLHHRLAGRAARARRDPDRHHRRHRAVDGAGLQRVQGHLLGPAQPGPHVPEAGHPGRAA
ncbi:hypothetical protein G6F68_019232 [Rhizopus microsporus]|nr:hypothetical protein G6F68_019232 [Rhizopus microsporus]